MERQGAGHLEGSASSIPDKYKNLQAFGRIVRLDPKTGAEHTEEHEFIRIELAVAWVRWQLESNQAMRGGAYLRDSAGRVRNVAIRDGATAPTRHRVVEQEAKVRKLERKARVAKASPVEVEPRQAARGRRTDGVKSVEESYLSELVDVSIIIQKIFRPLRFVDTPSRTSFVRAQGEWEHAALTLNRCESILSAARQVRLGASDRALEQITETIDAIEIKAERLLFRLDWQTDRPESSSKDSIDATIYDISALSQELRDYASRTLVNAYAGVDERAEIVLAGRARIEMLPSTAPSATGASENATPKQKS